MKMKLLTIFTPTYNRGYILPQLYDSLLRQSDKRFEWVIIDDGSIDNTETLVEEWKKEDNINIIYCKQENQGKHIAINTGVNKSSGELFFIVDSDDYLAENAVETIFDFWNQKELNENQISGIISYRKFSDNKLVGTRIPKEVEQCKLRDAERKYGSKGDKVVIYRTDILRQFSYPKFENERFLGESYVFNQIDDKYNMFVLDDALYYFAYRPDGLSQNFRKLYRDNPRGFLATYEQTIRYAERFKEKVKISAHIVCLRLRLGIGSKFLQGEKILIRLLAILMGIVLYIKIFIMKTNDVKPYVGTEEIEKN